jgi:alpha-tubulin suppressor-like RCC1 family protein
MSVSCGKSINAFAIKNGTLLSWGKGDHEKPKFDDFIEYSTPYPMLEEKNIVFVSCGLMHIMCLSQ